MHFSLIFIAILLTLKESGTQNFTPKEFYVALYWKVNWYAAVEICGSYNLSLASVNNLNEKAKLRAFMQEKGLPIIKKCF